MENNNLKYRKVKKKYLKFLSSQEVMSEPFRDKLGQLNKFYLPNIVLISGQLFFNFLKLLPLIYFHALWTPKGFSLNIVSTNIFWDIFLSG